MLPIISRLALPLLIFIAGSIFGIFLQQRVFDKPCRFTCPEIPPCPKVETQSIDFEKIKGFKGTINLHQYYTVHVQGDSTLIVKAIHEAVKNNRLRK